MHRRTNKESVNCSNASQGTRVVNPIPVCLPPGILFRIAVVGLGTGLQSGTPKGIVTRSHWRRACNQDGFVVGWDEWSLVSNSQRKSDATRYRGRKQPANLAPQFGLGLGEVWAYPQMLC